MDGPLIKVISMPVRVTNVTWVTWLFIIEISWKRQNGFRRFIFDYTPLRYTSKELILTVMMIYRSRFCEQKKSTAWFLYMLFLKTNCVVVTLLFKANWIFFCCCGRVETVLSWYNGVYEYVSRSNKTNWIT